MVTDKLLNLWHFFLALGLFTDNLAASFALAHGSASSFSFLFLSSFLFSSSFSSARYKLLNKTLLGELTSFLRRCCFEGLGASSGRPPFLPHPILPSSSLFRSPSRRRRLSSACHQHCYCGINFRLRFQLPGLPAGVKFSPTSPSLYLSARTLQRA